MKLALERAHTARHSPLARQKRCLIHKNGQEEEESRNMVSVPEGALGKLKAWLNRKAPPLHRENVRAIRTVLNLKS